VAIKRAFPKGPRMPSPAPRVAYAARDEDHESNLAWDMVEVHRDALSLRQRNNIFLALGCQDFLTVITQVLESIERRGQVLDDRLAWRVLEWLSCYRQHAAEPRLRSLAERCMKNQGPFPAKFTLRRRS